MRLFLAFVTGGFALQVVDSTAVFFITLTVVWIALQIVSPGRCPYCRKYVKLFASHCHHCGHAVREA